MVRKRTSSVSQRWPAQPKTSSKPIDLERRLENWVIDPQAGSPIFSRLPVEIRHEIFVLALAPRELFLNVWWKYEDADSCSNPPNFCVRHDHDGDPDEDVADEIATKKPLGADDLIRRGGLALRVGGGRFPPGTGPSFTHRRLSTTLLATCRRVFAEARLLIFEHERGHESGPSSLMLWNRPAGPGSEGPGVSMCCVSRAKWSRERTEWERRFPRLSLSGNPEYYYGFFTNKLTPFHPADRVLHKRYPWSKVKHLRLCPIDGHGWNLQRNLSGDWRPLIGLGDYRRPQTLLQTFAHSARTYCKAKHEALASPGDRKDDGIEDPGRPRPNWMPATADSYTLNSWAREFVNFPSIETLTMNFHCTETQRAHFEAIIEYVVDTWRFPLNPLHAGYHYLSAEGNAVDKMSWRGQMGHWERSCLECGKPAIRIDEEGWCATHAASREKVSRIIGPRMYTWTVTWTRRKETGPEQYPYRGLVHVAEGDYWQDGDSELDEQSGDEADEDSD
ncbi:hypothetical protein PspLS_08609 [Pyricularia sp. CBS 133598]|nr:hypothetical protein PspLS_08609 [Pyricularia sp. CBS 133598]